MLRGLLGFGKEDRPQPPKGKIEVVCPTCGAFQYEPRLVVSTICRKCGDHLRIEKKRVIGSGLRKDAPTATVSMPQPLETKPPEPSPAPKSAPLPARSPLLTGKPAASSAAAATPAASKSSPLRTIIAAGPPPPPAASATGNLEVIGEPAIAPTATPEEDEDGGSELGFGSMLKKAARSRPNEAPPTEADDTETAESTADTAETSERRISRPPAPTPAPPPATAGTLQKMKDQGFYRQQYFKDAQCFDCNHAFKVGRSARSASCPQCGSLISLEDVEINMNSTQEVKTRGDVIIRKRGHLSTASVRCRDLRCFGQLEANVQCAGDAVFRTTGSIIGEVRCRRFIIEKGAEVAFVNPVYADEVEIHAKITGTIFCRGPVLISSYGAVNGDVTARSVSIEPGGELNGAMNIIRSDSLFFAPTTRPAASS